MTTSSLFQAAAGTKNALREKPFVSVCIPTFNSAHTLGATLKSITAQTYADIEIVVSDNASTDATRDVVASFKDQRLRYSRNPVNIGIIGNYNHCLRLAKADLIAIYHADDIYRPDIVEKEVEFLLGHPEVGSVSTLGRFVDENNRVISQGVRIPFEVATKDTLSFPELMNILMRRSGSFLFFPTLMAYRSEFKEVGDFREFGTDKSHIMGACDMDMFLRLARRKNIGVIKERLVDRGVSSTHFTGQYLSQRTSRSVHFVSLDDFLKGPGVYKMIYPRVMRQYEFNRFWDDVLIAVNLTIQGRRQDATCLLRRAWKIRHVLSCFSGFSNFMKCILAALLSLSLFFLPDNLAKQVCRGFYKIMVTRVWNN